jgi:DNA topoisomerase-3
MFNWCRGRLFDRNYANLLYDLCLENEFAIITSIEKRERRKFKPLPLTTVMLQKQTSRLFHISAHKTMEIAEKLYTQGYISYPRTETDSFHDDGEVRRLIQLFSQYCNDGNNAPLPVVLNSRIASTLDSLPILAKYAYTLLNNNGYRHPRKGKNDDKSHPPIHPTKFDVSRNSSSIPGNFRKFDNGNDDDDDGNNGSESESYNVNRNTSDENKNVAQLTGDYLKVYLYICRHFLACCSDDAVGAQTIVNCVFGTEDFEARGNMIISKNYLNIFIDENWGEKTIPLFYENQKIFKKELLNKNDNNGYIESFLLNEGQTSAPLLLSETELISQMDKTGIGTDATIAQHMFFFFFKWF